MPEKKSRALSNARWEKCCQLFVFGNPKHNPDPTKKDDPSNGLDTRNQQMRSYVEAGFKAKGASAHSAAWRLFRRVEIQARINELRDEEQRWLGVHMRRWRAMLPRAQAVLDKALDGKDVTAQQIAAAREVIEQSEGPSRFRFGVQTNTDRDGSLNVTLWSGRRHED